MPCARLSVAAAFAVVSAFVAASPAHACNVPVFRYALERWRADPYQVFVFHDRPMTKEQEAILASLRDMGEDGKAAANFTVETADVGKPLEGAAAEAWKAQASPELPRIVIRYPDGDGRPPAIWAAPLSADAIKSLTDSPVRRTVAKRLMAGESVVWVMLEIGDKKKDDAAAALLAGELKKLEKTIPLPPGVGEEGSRLKSELPLKIAFSMLRMSRTDPAEKPLLEMLLRSEPDLLKLEEPMVFPVFGRGRSLEALVGKGINPEVIKETAEFLCGKCGCEVKKQNPGFDLLMTADWDSILVGGKAEVVEPPPLTGLPTMLPVKPAEPAASTKAATGAAGGSPAGVPAEAAKKAEAPAATPECCDPPSNPRAAPAGAPRSAEGKTSPPGSEAPAEGLLSRNLILTVVGGILLAAAATLIVLRR